MLGDGKSAAGRTATGMHDGITRVFACDVATHGHAVPGARVTVLGSP